MDDNIFHFTLLVNIALSCMSFLLAYKIIPNFREMFIKANMFGIDMNKMTKYKVPEAQGVIAGAIFLITLFVFIPVPFYRHLTERELDFPFQEYVQFLAALLSICCMIFLGFADDALNLRWRHKMLLPSIATLPLLMVYIVTFDLTVIIVPKPLRPWIGDSLDIGLIYYLYMGMLAVFCTNAINILAGINGIEAGQSFVIALTVVVFNIIELNGAYKEAHQFSLYLMLPFTAVCGALLIHNWYPSRVFVGDTFCYFAGMTFAVVAILGHFSKTMLLFFIPQVANFVFSIPQLFHIVHCPRHRLPRFDRDTNKLNMSYSVFKTSDTGFLAKIILWVFSLVGVSDVKYKQGEDGQYTECSNFTIINLALKILGPTHEKTLTIYLLTLQVCCSILALFIRYPLALLFYDA